AEPDPALRARPGGRVDAADGAAQHRLDHHPAAVVEPAAELVAGDKWEAGQRVHVKGGVAGDGGDVRAADPAHLGVHAVPVRARELGRLHVLEVQQGEGARRNVRPAAGGLDQGVGGDVAVEGESEHSGELAAVF